MHAPAQSSPTSTRPRVLVVDDDPEIGHLLSRYLSGQGLGVSVAENGSQLRAAMAQLNFDVVLLDLGLPDEDGLALMRELRTRWHGPIIIVSGRGESVERVVGLELGADDYVSKPFDLRELLARIRSVMRRVQTSGTAESPAVKDFQFDGMRLEPAARCLVGRDGEQIPLTSGEYELLQALLERPNQVLTRDELMSAMHGRNAGPFDRAIDVQIGRLRKKIEPDPGSPKIIKSVRGAGYILAATVRRG